jgi:hypothetical protein
MFDYREMPSQGYDMLKAYLETGEPLGDNSFFYYVVTNNLKMACYKADSINENLLHAWVKFLWNEAPDFAWGSKEAYDAWIAEGGRIGRGIERRVAYGTEKLPN